MNTALEVLEAAGLEKSYWGEIIIAAENQGKFENADVHASEQWTDCACGKLDPRIPRHEESSQPLDGKLASKGFYFQECVESDDFLEAAHVLVDIEKRSCEILTALERSSTKNE